MEPAYKQLLEDHKFRISVYDGDGDSFVAQFRRCWKTIPLQDRGIILRHWNNAPYDHLPLFELSDLWVDSEIAHAQVKGPGYQIRFASSSFRLLPEPVALFVIAHELAHVYRWALGKDPREAKKESETKTDAIAEGWGFDKKARDMLCFLHVRLGRLDEACRLMSDWPAAGATP